MAFYLGLCRLRGNLSLPAPTTVILQAGHFFLRQRQSSRLAVQYCDNGLPQAELLFFETTKIRIGRAPLRQILLQASYSSLRQRKFESDTESLRLRLLQAGHSTRRNDGTAVILDFRPRIGNRCSQKVKTRAIRASILDFKPKLANRCSAEVKTGVIPAAQGLEQCAADGECRMGRDFGRRSRPWLRERVF